MEQNVLKTKSIFLVTVDLLGGTSSILAQGGEYPRCSGVFRGPQRFEMGTPSLEFIDVRLSAYMPVLTENDSRKLTK